MSRSSPTLTNPAHRFMEYKAGEGKLEYYDKEKQERINVPLPFEFLVLDELNTITGYNKPAQGSYYSNEVRNSKKEEFKIYLKKQHVYTGLYKNEQDVVQVPRAAKFTKSVYIIFKQDGEYVIGNIKLAGSAMTAWIEFTMQHKVQDSGKVIMTKGELVKGDQSDYYPPAFEYVKATKEEDAMAISLDKVLQVYLSRYFIAQGLVDTDDDEDNSIDPDLGKPTPEQLADFERRKAEKFGRKQLQADDFPDDSQEVYNNIASDDDPINLDDIPF